MHHHMLPGDLGLGQGRAKSLYPVRSHRGFVAVVLGRRRKDLQGLHARIAGSKGSHPDAAVPYRVRADEIRQPKTSCLSLAAVTVGTDV